MTGGKWGGCELAQRLYSKVESDQKCPEVARGHAYGWEPCPVVKAWFGHLTRRASGAAGIVTHTRARKASLFPESVVSGIVSAAWAVSLAAAVPYCLVRLGLGLYALRKARPEDVPAVIRALSRWGRR